MGLKNLGIAENHKLWEAISTIVQLEKRKGGYTVIVLSKETVLNFPKGKSTRLVCVINEEFSFSCGLNHMGDGSFFLIVAGKHLKKHEIQIGQNVRVVLLQDPNPLGVEMPEVLTTILDQDKILSNAFEGLTDGKKRSIIHTINRVKNIDLKIDRALSLLREIA
ncbi:MAG: YdeI/OmpD-associated family protein [Cyclobacteriaceae bacterium]